MEAASDCAKAAVDIAVAIRPAVKAVKSRFLVMFNSFLRLREIVMHAWIQQPGVNLVAARTFVETGS
jgi:hypothetical protein